MLENGNYTYQSEFARKYYAQGREEGREQGREEGRAQQAARAVLDVLEAREVVVNNELRDRILGTTDLETLQKWHRVAITAKSTEDLFR